MAPALVSPGTDAAVEQQRRAWFDNVVASLRVDELKLETGQASPEEVAFYASIQAGDADQMAEMMNTQGSQHFIKRLLTDYINQLRETRATPLELAVELSAHTILVWAEIADDAEQVEDALYVAEARVNARYAPFGFQLSTMVVEASDHAAVPAHYSKLFHYGRVFKSSNAG